jgi:multimeric flavodoxin WrbA/putative sterol carrier protein
VAGKKGQGLTCLDHQRLCGWHPACPPGKVREKENGMTEHYHVVAVNGSPHEGFGNTSQMLTMLGENLSREGLELEEIFLSQYQIGFCTGCATCLESGSCWVRDDYNSVVRTVLQADAVILASPVYIFNITAQMKTFLDRSLGYGHRPRGDWKPGLALSVSAGHGETWVADYLGQVLRLFGAFPVGKFTAIAVGPGEFWGREAVEARAADLARDLARAVKEGRRYPPTDQDLRYWQFMSNLIKENRDFMVADYEHWQELGLFKSFEAYVGQTRSKAAMGEIPAKAHRKHQQEAPETAANSETKSQPGEPNTARELLEMMPGALNPVTAEGLTATYQFEVSGSENFTAHLVIADGQANFHEGPADHPNITIKTPPEVWLAIARKELDGTTAFLSGQFRIQGDLDLLVKLKTLFVN